MSAKFVVKLYFVFLFCSSHFSPSDKNTEELQQLFSACSNLAALYQGDTRTRTIDVLVDGEKLVTWTSSGTTAAFETVQLGVTGQTIELEGVLTDSEWLSIMEVRGLHMCSAPRLKQGSIVFVGKRGASVFSQ